MRCWSTPAILAAVLSLVPLSLVSAQAAPALAVATSPAAVSTASEARAESAAAKHTSRITARFPSGTHRARSRLLVTGTVSGAARRRVRIQAKASNGTWVTLTQGRTTRDRTFAVRAPTWWVAKQKLRVYAPATRADRPAATRNGTMTVRRTYSPRGGKRFSYLLGTKARWNPCQPITVRVNPSRRPAHGLAQVKAAFRTISEASGLRFTYVGSTTFVPYKAGQSRTDHAKHADIAVAWSTPRVVPSLAGATMGMGGAQGDSVNGGPLELHNGAVVFDATQRLRGPKAWVRRQRASLVLHELGHAVGLNHVADKRQIMSPVLPSGSPRYARGDLRGLAAVGAQGGCIAHSVR